MLLGRHLFEDIRSGGLKQGFRFHSDARIIRGVFLQINNPFIPGIDDFWIQLDNNNFKDHVMFASLLMNNGKDRVFTDIPIDRISFQYVSIWGPPAPGALPLSMNKYIGISEFMLPTNTPVVPNAVHYIVLKISDELKSLYDGVAGGHVMESLIQALKIDMHYTY